MNDQMTMNNLLTPLKWHTGKSYRREEYMSGIIDEIEAKQHDQPDVKEEGDSGRDEDANGKNDP